MIDFKLTPPQPLILAPFSVALESEGNLDSSQSEESEYDESGYF